MDQKSGLKYFKTICLTAAFCSLGLCSSILGPCLPTLAHNLGVTVKSLSYIFTMRGCGYMLGAILSAILFKKINSQLVIALCLTLTVAGFLAAPFMPSSITLAISILTAGSSMGVLDAGGNVMCILLWGKKSEPWMQLLHFAFALGATLGPFAAKPFIMESPGADEGDLTAGTQVLNDTRVYTGGTQDAVKETFPRVAWTFIIAASFAFIVSIGFYSMSFSKHRTLESSQEDTIEQEGKVFRLQILGLLFVFYLVYVGTEVTFASYIYSFAINCERRYTKHSGTLLNSLFWGSFAVGRFSSIFISKFISPRTMLSLDVLGTTVSTIVMSLFSFYYATAEWLMWGAVAIYGWSMASLFPSGISWAERYITMTESAATVLVVGSSVGEMTLPLILGHRMSAEPMHLMYFCAICSGVILANCLILHKVASRRGPRSLLKRENVKESDTRGVEGAFSREEKVLLPNLADIEEDALE